MRDSKKEVGHGPAVDRRGFLKAATLAGTGVVAQSVTATAQSAANGTLAAMRVLIPPERPR